MIQVKKKFFSFLIAIFFAFQLFAQKDISESVIIKDDWTNHFEYLFNIGDKAVNFENILFQEILNLERVEKLPGFESPKRTRFILSTYELQHRGVVDFVKMAISNGYQVKVIADGNVIQKFKPLTKNQIAKLSDNQKSYYYKTYDINEDGIVDKSDIEKVNSRNKISRWCWSELEKLQAQKPGLLKLMSSPSESVPGINLNFPRIHHWKEYGVQFYKNGNWADIISLIPSSNLTNTCLNHEKGRISNSLANFLRYTRADQSAWDKALREKKITEASYQNFMNAEGEDKYKIQFAKTSDNPQTGKKLRSGHVQFGQFFRSSKILKIFKGRPVDRWVNQYRQNKFFDSARAKKRFLPEVIFDDKKKGTYSRLRAYYSEGLKVANADTDFVMTAYNSILSDPGNSLRVFKSTQFVATHPRIINKINQALGNDVFEDFMMVVDGNFSSETYSAFPRLVSSQINDQAFTPWTKALKLNDLSPEQKLKTLSSMYSFDGNLGIYGGREGIKLHAKMSYMEYIDSHGVRHYVVIHGSGNLSVNAGKGNADGLIVFDTTDSRLKEQIDPYFEGLKNNARTKPFLETLLQKRLAHMIKYNHESSLEVKARGFDKAKEVRIIEQNYDLLNIDNGKLTKEFANLIKGNLTKALEGQKLDEIIAILSSEQANLSAFNKNFVDILKYFRKLETPFRLDQLIQSLYLSNPQNHPYQGFTKRIEIEWLKTINKKDREAFAKEFRQLINGMTRFSNSHEEVLLDPTAREIISNCDLHFRNLGVDDFARIKTKKDKK